MTRRRVILKLIAALLALTSCGPPEVTAWETADCESDKAAALAALDLNERAAATLAPYAKAARSNGEARRMLEAKLARAEYACALPLGIVTTSPRRQS